MTSAPRLRMTREQGATLYSHLYPGDGNEAVAFALCGAHRSDHGDVILVHDVHPVPYSMCSVRSPEQVTWDSSILDSLIPAASNKGLTLVKFHSHPNGIGEFSDVDDTSDHELLMYLNGWLDGPHGSVVITPDGAMHGRIVTPEDEFVYLRSVMVIGEDIEFFPKTFSDHVPEHAVRHAQLFGPGTAIRLKDLRVGIIGCSGTGGFVIEMLARLGVRELVLVDPDRVEYRNLNRIIGTTAADAALKRFKVDVLAEHVSRIGLGVQVRTSADQIASINSVEALAGCDVVFGCMDSHDGRRTLNRLATFYLIPYFDCGVGLTADGTGGINEVCSACHYVQPGKSSLFQRGVVKQTRADAEAMARNNPSMYQRLHEEDYLEGIKVDSPSVITVNALAASMVMNDFLARIHPYRYDSNSSYASVRFNLVDMYLDIEPESAHQFLVKAVGRGDLNPLLDMSELSKKSYSV